MIRTKIHPLILLALLISSAAMALYAYQNFNAGEAGYGTVFLLMFIAMLGLVIYGLNRNKRTVDEKKS